MDPSKNGRFSIEYINDKIFRAGLEEMAHFGFLRGEGRDSLAGETQQFPIRLEITSMIGSDRRELLPGRNYTGTIAREIH